VLVRQVLLQMVFVTEFPWIQAIATAENAAHTVRPVHASSPSQRNPRDAVTALQSS
jgi:hypothetical protein